MGGVGPLLALEVDLGIAALAAGTWHRGGLGFGRFRLIFGGGVGTGRAAGVIFGWRATDLRLELFMDAQAFTSVPSTEK